MDEERAFSQAHNDNEEQLEPVVMPDLPTRLVVNTSQQFKALGDPTRTRILGIIQNQPATAKQIADRLGIAPGTIGHHLQVLEAAGLAQIVARRIIHGIVAKYYTRTARIFVLDFPAEIKEHYSVSLEIMDQAHQEMHEAQTMQDNSTFCRIGFPHARLSAERVRYYEQCINQLIDEFLQEPQPSTEQDSQIYSLFLSLFVAPPYMQRTSDKA